MTGPHDSPGELSPRAARDRFLEQKRLDCTERTVRSYQNRLTRFCEWCEEAEIERVDELDGWLLDEYRRSLTDDEPVTVKGKLMAVKQLVGYLEDVDAVQDDLEDAVPIPNLSHDQERSEQRLESEDALALLRYYRNSTARRGTPWHAVLELLWFTGMRMSALRALDLRDYDDDRGILRIRHRPPSTRLKNGADGERSVAIPPTTVDVVDEFVARERPDVRDENGRQPLIACRQGRPADSTIRAYCYRGTQPCLYTECPHGNQRHRCEYTDRSHASKCPSSRAAHAIRTGSISWQLNQGLPVQEVAERVNASPATIRRHYDVATDDEKLEERRRHFVDNLSVE